MADLKVGVVYLAWLPYGAKYLKRFLESYNNKLAGAHHSLIFILNGTSLVSAKELEAFKNIIHSTVQVDYKVHEFYGGQDIEAYRKLAAIDQHEILLFLNTFSEFKAQDWLQKYLNHFNASVGIIGATGSYASYYSAIRQKTKYDLLSAIGFFEKVKSVKYFLKLFALHRSNFKNFPAPHIRTNAFLIRRNLFLSLQCKHVRNKMDAYCFENGKASMTNQVLKMGLNCLLVDKEGKAYDIPHWPESGTFWLENQENLLISDNQTARYEQATKEEKRKLSYFAWENIKI